MLKLDLGAGHVSPEGYTPLGNEHGSAIYPLSYSDGAADAIRASHVLEHFSHTEAEKVVAEWVRVLKPGGALQIAVPDYPTCHDLYKSGYPMQAEQFIMGAHSSPDDFHKSLWDRDYLKRVLSDAGLTLIRPWKSPIPDVAATAISLNLEGSKPIRNPLSVKGVMSAPRLGFNEMWNCATMALPTLNIPFRKIGGAFWGPTLTGGLEMFLDDGETEYALVIDYDSVFDARAVAMLIQLAMISDADAIAPIQASRHDPQALFSFIYPEGSTRSGNTVHVPADFFAPDLVPVKTAHFGCTLIKLDALRRLARPWFLGTPNADGRWREGRTDEDTHFWRQWEKCGLSLMLAPKVVIGHLELCVRWPDSSFAPLWQTARDWEEKRQPPPGTWTGEF